MPATAPHPPDGRRHRRRHGWGRRATGLVAASVATALLVSGCGADAQADDSISVMVIKHGLTKPMAEMAWVQQLEEAAGVPVEWEEVSSDWDQKKNPMLAAGDVPDVIIGFNAVTDQDLVTFHSLFEDLSDDMDALPNAQAMFDEVDGAQELVTRDGAVRALPSYKKYWPQAITHQYVNQQWLDTLGLEAPTTWDELFEVLTAFKEGDPNGNGQADEIPMDFSPVGTTGFGYFQPTALLGSTGMQVVNGGGNGYFLEDGEVKNLFVDERYRDLVEFLHRCWEAGLMSPDAFTQDYSTYQSVARGTGDQARVGFSWGWSASDRFGPGVYQQYAAIGQLQQEAGQRAPVRWSWDYENLTPNAVLVSSSTPHKDAVLRMVDRFYAPDTSVQVLWGDLGTNVEKSGDEQYTVLPPADPALDPSTWKWTSTVADNGPFFIRPEMEVQLPADLSEAVADSAPLQPAYDGVDVLRDVYPQPFLKLDEDDTLVSGLNDTAVLGVVMPQFAQWVTRGGATRDWDEHVETVLDVGLAENVEIRQRYYDEYAASR